MADPTPLSFESIFGRMLRSFQARVNLQRLYTENSLVATMEAAARADARASQDVFAALTSRFGRNQTGVQLDLTGEAEDVPRLGALSARGYVTITDTSFVRLASTISGTTSPPAVGASSILVVDASAWPSTGDVYIGRGTERLEGPIEYTSKTSTAQGWEIALASALGRSHLAGESVVVAQGGTRVIGTDTVVKSSAAQGSGATVTFSVAVPATILDGETTVAGVLVVANQRGTIGNIGAGGLNSFETSPFANATVTNPAPFANGADIERDEEYFSRIVLTRAGRVRGIDEAIRTGLKGVVSREGDARVLGVEIVRGVDGANIVIDDGTGYEETDEGVSIEPIVDVAVGGEQRFNTLQWPIAKASVVSRLAAPFDLTDLTPLAVSIGGTTTTHAFANSDFADKSRATAYEVVNSINAASALLFEARTASGGTRVVLRAKAETNDAIAVVAGTDAFGFSSSEVETTRLYRNGRLLKKDGSVAALLSAPRAQWGSLTSSETLNISIDGIAVVATFVPGDFPSGSATSASLSEWAEALNDKVPGVSATVETTQIKITSNRGRAARASLAITGGSLVSAGMFAVDSVTGADNDYAIDRASGDLVLVEPLEPGDSLALGSFQTRAFIESAEFAEPLASVADAVFWYALDDVDVAPVSISVPLADDYTLNKISTLSNQLGEEWELANLDTADVLTSVAAGHWVIMWDPAIPAALRGIHRVTARPTTSSLRFRTWVTGASDTAFNFSDVNIRVVSATVSPKRAALPNGSNYTPSSISSGVTGTSGSFVSTYQSDKLRWRSNTFGPLGSLSLLGTEGDAGDVGFPEETRTGDVAHLGVVLSSYTLSGGTPQHFDLAATSGIESGFMFGCQYANTASYPTASDNVELLLAPSVQLEADRVVVVEARSDSNDTGNSVGIASTLVGPTGAEVALPAPHRTTDMREPVNQRWRNADRFVVGSPLIFSERDTLGVIVDGDEQNKGFDLQLSRRIQPDGATYAQTFDVDDFGGSALSLALGDDFDLNDFAVYMRARNIMDSGTATRAVLWRAKRTGPDGELLSVRYAYPKAPSQVAAVEIDDMPTEETVWSAHQRNLVSLVLPSGAAKTFTAAPSSMIGTHLDDVGGRQVVTLALHLRVTSATRASNVTTLTLELPSGTTTITNSGLGSVAQIALVSTDPDFPSGVYAVTGGTGATVTITDPGVDVGPKANIGYAASALSTTGTTFLGSTIAVGDLIYLADYPNIPAILRDHVFRVNTYNNGWVQGYLDSPASPTVSPASTLAWQHVGDFTQIRAFALSAPTASAFVTSINALSASPVSGVVVGAGSALLDLSSQDRNSSPMDATEYLNLVDGVNWVQSYVAPAAPGDPYEITLKKPITAGLIADPDWANEQLWLTPTTPKNVVDWFANERAAPIAVTCAVDLANKGQSVQIATLTPGSEGSVEITGGTANALVAPVTGVKSSTTTGIGGTASLYVDSTDAENIKARGFVRLTTAKETAIEPFGAGVSVASVDAASGLVTIAGGVTYAVRAAATTATVAVRKHGDFATFYTRSAATPTDTTFSTLRRGDIVSMAANGGSPLAAANRGVFRVVAAAPGFVTVYHPTAIEETAVGASVRQIISGLMPGDRLSVSTDIWGADFVGVWEIVSVGATGTENYVDTTKIALRRDGAALLTGARPALGTESPKVVGLQAPWFRVKQVLGVVDLDDGRTAIKVRNPDDLTGVTAQLDPSIVCLDKLGFVSSAQTGIDGYRKNTGLLAEAARVAFGDDSDRARYLGIVARGSKVGMSGPKIRTLKLSLSIRVRLGTSPSAVAARVRSEVAGVVARYQQGSGALDVASLIRAARNVPGVVAATMITPTTDTIALVQGERPLIVDAQRDISVIVVGE